MTDEKKSAPNASAAACCPKSPGLPCRALKSAPIMCRHCHGPMPLPEATQMPGVTACPFGNPSTCKEEAAFRLVGDGIEAKFCLKCNVRFQTRAVEPAGPSSGSAAPSDAAALRAYDWLVMHAIERDDGDILVPTSKAAAVALATLLADVRRETIEACIRAADSGPRECVTGCHGRLQDLLKGGSDQ